jgi:hypothetical protein
MKHASLLLLLLLVFRVCVIPLGFVSQLKQSTVSFEQVRIKKRRTSYCEEEAHAPVISTRFYAAGIVVQQSFPFSPKKTVTAIARSIGDPALKFQLFTPEIHNCLYLLNRVLRI